MPANLSRLLDIQTTLQQALSHALASCAVSPSSDTGIVRDVLTHVSLTNYSGLSTTFEIDDLRRLCWLWEWDRKKAPAPNEVGSGDEDNPFLDTPEVPTPPKDWSRGGMGFVVTPTTHLTRSTGTRAPAYGIGIEVEIDIDKDMGGGMAAVARWAADTESRKAQFKSKLEKWLKVCGPDLDTLSICLFSCRSVARRCRPMPELAEGRPPSAAHPTQDRVLVDEDVCFVLAQIGLFRQDSIYAAITFIQTIS